ncbi:MAG: polyphosphate kinase 1 [Planctomycetia bacterium]
MLARLRGEHALPGLLSLLEFNRRVLAQAADPSLPLLERLRFLTIFSSNLDEFFEVRVAGLREQQRLGIRTAGPDGLQADELLRRISEVAHGLVAEAYGLLADQLMPALEAEGVRVLDRHAWPDGVLRWARRHYGAEVAPVLTPVALDPAHPFPTVLNKGLSFLVALEGQDAFGREGGVAVLQVPRSLPRLVPVPAAVAGDGHTFVPLSAIVDEHMGDLFPGMQVTACFPFRITRNSELWVDEEEADNLLQALQGQLPQRNFGTPVRLEVGEACPPEMVRLLLQKAELGPDDLYRVPGPVNLKRLDGLYEQVQRPDLKFQPFEPGLPPRLKAAASIFEVLQQGDVLLHHPYESFAPVVELVRQAAADPDVLAIKQTLYRTGPGNPLVQALVDAARAGKDVTAVVELRARFDEAANIALATSLQQAGANTVYGIVGYKTHAKMLLVVRREGGRLRRYVHLGTGNYHQGNAAAYSDLGLMTADRAVGKDVHDLFLELTGLGKAPRLERLRQAPFTLHAWLVEMIDAEAAEARAGRPARIEARMNGLSDPWVIQALYRASQAGVPIDLVVRGICALRPGVPGVSQTIRVRSVVGRFLEHARAWRFHAAGQDQVWCASADWMERNLLRRVETAFPVTDDRARQRVIDEALRPHLADNVQAWELQADGTWVRCRPAPGEAPRIAQAQLLERLARAPQRALS